jgi:hypothetical protein
VPQQGVQALDSVGHPAGTHALDLLDGAEFGALGQVLPVGRGVPGGQVRVRGEARRHLPRQAAGLEGADERRRMLQGSLGQGEQ